jgi:myo-inositol-1(or 4)-monophosphatase
VSEGYGAFLAEAERIAREAGRVLRDAFGRVSAREKGPADLVTEADLASQDLVARRLAEAFPDHTLLAEEDGVGPPTDFDCAWRWIVDPLDGTMNFAHGFPFWCISIALEHAGRPVVGVVHNPLTGELYSAAIGMGARKDGAPMSVSAADRLSQSLITTALPLDFPGDADRQTAYMKRFSSGTHSLRRTGSSALNLALLASGACEVCYASAMHPWDAAAGVVLVREAGGEVTRFSGAPHDLYGQEILATNGRVHAESIAALAEAWPNHAGRP